MFILMPAAAVNSTAMPVFNSDSPESELNVIYSLASRPHLNWSPFNIKVPGDHTLIPDCLVDPLNYAIHSLVALL